MRLLLIILLATLMVSCNKELADDFVPYPTSLQPDTTWKPSLSSSATVNEIFDIFQEHVYIQGFYAETGGSFIINDSLKIEVPANALMKNGNLVTGLVSVNIHQFRTKGQLIASNISTCDSQALQTPGAFHVEFYQNSDKLSVSPNKKYVLIAKHLSGEMISNAAVYIRDVLTSVQSTWSPATDGSAVINSSFQGSPAYFIQSTALGWLAPAKPVNATGADLIRVNVILPLTFTNANTVAFAVFKDYNSVIRLKTDVTSKSFYTEGIPSGKTLKIVTISKINDQFYFGFSEATVVKGTVIKVTPEKKASAKEIVSIILNL